ncbi:MAG TPA: YoaK family protein [Oligoflexia bacterium]|nr:YoaK family protein [Oligoflexia bacterium]HMR24313.1 YoaK family protein [Oligoflexia bacterium]
MIFGNETISTYSRSNMMIWFIMALQAGLLNVGGFLAANTFISHVTGFATAASVQIEMGNTFRFLGLVLIPVAFLFGAMISGVLIDLRIKLKKKPKYYWVFGLMFFLSLLVTVGGFNDFFGEFGHTPESINGYSLVVLLCFICGIQNGAVSLVSKSVVRTTHLTGITTDLGIGLVRIINRKRISDINDEGKANLMRSGIILFFVIGSLAGVPVFQQFEFRGFLLPCLISGFLFFIMFVFQVVIPFFKSSKILILK